MLVLSERVSRTRPGRISGYVDMLKTRQDCWPDEDSLSERYLYVDVDGDGKGYGEARIVIMEEGVFADDAKIVFKTKAELEEWVRILRMAWDIKAKQDEKGWRKRD